MLSSVSNGMSPHIKSKRRMPRDHIVAGIPWYCCCEIHSGGLYTRVPSTQPVHARSTLSTQLHSHNCWQWQLVKSVHSNDVDKRSKNTVNKRAWFGYSSCHWFEIHLPICNSLGYACRMSVMPAAMTRLILNNTVTCTTYQCAIPSKQVQGFISNNH